MGPLFRPFAYFHANISRVSSFCGALVKIIATFGCALKYSTNVQAHWYYALKGRKISLEDTKMALAIMKEHSEYAKNFIHTAIQKAKALSLMILNSDLNLTQKKESNFKELFAQCFKSLMEMNIAKIPQNILTTITYPEINKLFGAKVHLLKSGKEIITCIAEREKLGQGAYNTVYLAVDLWNAKVRAFRKLNDDFHDKVNIERLQKENELQCKLQAISGLKSGIVKIYQIFSQAPFFGSLLKFCEKGTLFEAIEDKILSNYDKKAIAIDVFTFFANLHKNGYIYSDLKTENILLVNEKQPNAKNTFRAKVADFGGANHENDNNETQIITLSYLAPEAYNTKLTTKATEVWALGILLYELKFGDIPEFADEAIELLFDEKGNYKSENESIAHEIFKEGCIELSEEINKNDPYDQIILSALKYDPNERATVKTMCKMLHDTPVESF